ncbi:poly polymerase, catalytic region domain-containing protein, partial [Reticulomyxa filosa]
KIDFLQVKRHCDPLLCDTLEEILTQKAISKQCLNTSCNHSNVLFDPTRTDFVCERCNKSNCLRCNLLHEPSDDCKHFLFNQSNAFRKKWTGVHQESTTVLLQSVTPNSEEWNELVGVMKYNNIVKIERVEHNLLWRKYAEYCVSLGSQYCEQKVHHGTRQNQPQLIYTNGFDLTKAKVGHCLWFAVESQYSRNGYQFSLSNGQAQIFISLIASGNPEHVKFIRGNTVLNVYKNEATYPAYLVTFR